MEQYGSLQHIQAADSLNLRPALPLHRIKRLKGAWLWRPKGQLAAELPLDVGVGLVECELADGTRIFSPVDTSSDREALRAHWSSANSRADRRALGPQRHARDHYRSFIEYAWVCGYAICRVESPELFSPDLEPTPDMLWQLFNRAQAMKSFQHRQISSSKDLLDPTKQYGEGPSGFLAPWPIGQESNDSGLPQSVNELRLVGRRSAQAAGVAVPRSSQSIRFALADVAKKLQKDPGSHAQRERVLTSALFATTSDIALSPDLARAIELDLFVAIRRRIETGDDSKFDEWFSTTSGTLVKQIAQLRTELPGESATEAVCLILQNLGFYAYRDVSKRISRVLLEIANSLPEPLSDVERRCFERLYCPQHALCGLSLIVLRDKLQLAEGLLMNLLADPDDKFAWPFYSLLTIYIAVTERKRAADRDRKRTGRATSHDALKNAADQSKPDRIARMNQLVIAHLQRAGLLHCRCKSGAWQVSEFGQVADVIRIVLECGRCSESVTPIDLSHEQLREILGDDFLGQ